MIDAVLGPRGLPMVSFGGDKAWIQRVKGDIVVSYQWLDLKAIQPDYEGPDGPMPCMCLFSTSISPDKGTHVIPQVMAYLYADNKGNPTARLAGSAFQAAVMLGFNRMDRSAINRLIDVIVDGLSDLIRMPSEPPADYDVARAVQGIEATIKVGGKTVLEILQ